MAILHQVPRPRYLNVTTNPSARRDRMTPFTSSLASAGAVWRETSPTAKSTFPGTSPPSWYTSRSVLQMMNSEWSRRDFKWPFTSAYSLRSLR